MRMQPPDDIKSGPEPAPAAEPAPVAGYWAVALTNGGEEMHWGKDGGTLYPHTTKAEAIGQIEYLVNRRTHNEDRLYVMTVFTNGQILWEEHDYAEPISPARPPG